MTLFSWIYLLSVPVSAMIAEIAPSVSPEQLRAIIEIIKAVGASGGDSGALSAEYIKAIAGLISAIAWPIAAVLCVLVFRRQLSPSYSAGLEFELTGVAQSVELA